MTAALEAVELSHGWPYSAVASRLRLGQPVSVTGNSGNGGTENREPGQAEPEHDAAVRDRSGHLIESTAFQEIPEYEFMYGLGYSEPADDAAQPARPEPVEHRLGGPGPGGTGRAGIAAGAGSSSAAGVSPSAERVPAEPARTASEPASAAREQPSPAQSPTPVIGPTPALRGQPGGPGFDVPGRGQRDRGLSRVVRKTGASGWQRALAVWRASGVEWQRPVPGRERALTELERIPTKRSPSTKQHADPQTGAPSGTRPADPKTDSAADSPARPPVASQDDAPPRTRRAESAPAWAAKSWVARWRGGRVTPDQVPQDGRGRGPGAGLRAAPSRERVLRVHLALPRLGHSRMASRKIAALRTGIVLTVAAVVAVAAVLVLTGRARKPAQHAIGYPAASLADGSFTTGSFARARGIDQSITRIVAADGTIVAVGSQIGARIPRAQFFVSSDGGHTWRIAPVSAAGGGEPPPGHLPLLVAGGHGAWLAVGPIAIWTSKNGRSWVLSSTRGITPPGHGDQVWVLTRTASGFLAGGVSRPSARGPATAVFWTSADGLRWRRHGAGQLGRRLGPGRAAGAGRAMSISYAAAHGGDTVVAGATLQTRRAGSGSHRHTVVSYGFGVWHSGDGGLTWAPAAVPVSNGAANWIDGIASDGSGFLAIRPRPAVPAPARTPAKAGTRTKAPGGRASTAPTRTPAGGVAYLSTHGSSWKYAGQVKLPGDIFQPLTVKGSAYGFAVIGQASHGYLVALVSTDGRSWRPTLIGRAPAESISGVTPAPDGTVVAVGATAVDPVTRRPVLAVAAPRRAAVNVDPDTIAGATDPQLAVSAVAAAGNRTVAVGSANGYPAIWSATAGRPWSAATGTQAGVLARPGIQTLTDVVHGPAGWLGVGVVTSAAPAHPVVVTSASGDRWQAADSEPAFAVPGAYTYQAAAGHSSYVVAGKQVTGGGTVAAAWWSTALTGWHRATAAAPGDLGGSGVTGQMLAITAQPFGFIAVGSYGSHPAAWTSADGRQWLLRELPLPGGAAAALLTQVAAGGGRVVAMGTAGGAPFAAVSTDGGRTWRQTMLPAPSANARVTALTAAGRGFAATGTYGTPGNQDVVVWSSGSGRTWRVARPAGTGLSGPGIQAITALTASGRALTGVGYTASQAAEHPTIWRVPLR